MRLSRSWVAVATVLLMSACGGGSTAPPSPPGLPPDPPPVAVPEPSASAPSARPQLTWTYTFLTGRQGSVGWTVKVPMFAGPAVSAVVNRRVRASAQSAIKVAVAEGRDDQGERRTLSGEGEVAVNDGRTVQVRLSFTDNLAGTAHPIYSVATTALQAATGAPLTLDTVFTDKRAALRTLKPLILRAARAAGEEVSEPAGLAPRDVNWAAWQTSAFGMSFDFQDYQLGGHGLRRYTVPWIDVRPLLHPEARTLLEP